MTGLALALAVLLQVPGPVGGRNAVIPIEDHAAYFGTADVAWSPDADAYVNIYSGPISAQATSSFMLRSVKLSPRVDPVMSPLSDPLDLEGPGVTGSPAICWNPAAHGFLVAYVIDRVGGNPEFRALRLDADGAPVGASFVVSPVNGGVDETRPRIACDGRSWMIVWRGGGLRARGVDADGGFASDEFVVNSDTNAGNIDIARASGPDYLVAWRDGGTTYAVQGRTLSPDGSLGPINLYTTEETVAHGSESGAPGLVGVPDTGEFIVAWIQQTMPSDSEFLGTPWLRAVAPDGSALAAPQVADGYPADLVRHAHGGTMSLGLSLQSDQLVASWIEDGVLYAARLDPYRLELIEADIVLATPGSPFTAYTGPRPAMASRGIDSQVLVQWSHWPGTDYSQVRALRYDLGPSTAALAIDQAIQVDAAGAPIARGASIHAISFAIQGTFTSTRRFAAVEVEVREAGESFTSTPTQRLAGVESGVPFTIPVGGLAWNRGWHWQIRLADSHGPTPGVGFGGNPPDDTAVDLCTVNAVPTATALRQLRIETGEPIVIGAVLPADGVHFVVGVADEDGDDVGVEIEVAQVGAGFAGIATATSQAPAGGSCVLEVQLRGAAYHWQVRLTDSSGESGGWIAFGSNAEAAPDFTLLPSGSRGPSKACGLSAERPAAGGWLPPAALLLAALCLRERKR